VRLEKRKRMGQRTNEKIVEHKIIKRIMHSLGCVVALKWDHSPSPPAFNGGVGL